MTDKSIPLDILRQTGGFVTCIEPEVLEEARLQCAHEASRRIRRCHR